MWALILLEFGTRAFPRACCQLNSSDAVCKKKCIMNYLFYVYIAKHEQPCGDSSAVDDDEVRQALFIH